MVVLIIENIFLATLFIIFGFIKNTRPSNTIEIIFIPQNGIMIPMNDSTIIAFPDLGAYKRWLDKTLAIDFPIEVSDYLEKNATIEQHNDGLDIGDFL